MFYVKMKLHLIYRKKNIGNLYRMEKNELKHSFKKKNASKSKKEENSSVTPLKQNTDSQKNNTVVTSDNENKTSDPIDKTTGCKDHSLGDGSNDHKDNSLGDGSNDHKDNSLGDESNDPKVTSPLDDIEDILLNLKIMSQIKKGNRLLQNENKILEIESDDIIQPIRRWWSGRSRNITINQIKTIMQKTYTIIDSIFESIGTSNVLSSSNCTNLQRLNLELNNASKGIDNLKLTYVEDITVQSQLSIINEQLQLRLKQIYESMKIHKITKD